CSLRLWLGVTPLAEVQSLSCTAVLSPSRLTSSSGSEGGMRISSIAARSALDTTPPHIAAARQAQLASGRENDLVVARRHVGGRQLRAVVEFDVWPDLEAVSFALVSRLRHRGAEIADEIGSV